MISLVAFQRLSDDVLTSLNVVLPCLCHVFVGAFPFLVRQAMKSKGDVELDGYYFGNLPASNHVRDPMLF